MRPLIGNKCGTCQVDSSPSVYSYAHTKHQEVAAAVHLQADAGFARARLHCCHTMITHGTGSVSRET
eukprot:384516-Hanusia_phi.AAC.2